MEQGNRIGGEGNVMRAAALDYAVRGWPVLPVHTAQDGRCSCSKSAACDNAGKHPRTRHGVKDATVDAETIRAWWARWPSANVGIACGSTLGTVLDVDPRHDGDRTLARLVAAFGPLPATRLHATGGGGWHYIFGAVEGAKNAVGIGAGLDLRAAGGYIVAPPSLHASGGGYSVAEATIPAPAPGWLVDLITAARAKGWTGQTIPEGGRNAALASVAGALRARGVAAPDLARVLKAVNVARCDPPLTVAEVEQVADSIGRYPAKAEGNENGAAYTAVRAMLGQCVSDAQHVALSCALRAVWLPTGEIVEWRLTDQRDLQRDALAKVGDLTSFARRAHGQAGAATVLRALRDLVPNAPAAKSDELDDDDEPTALVRALLNGRLWHTLALSDGRATREPTTLATHPGDYLGDGVVLRQEQGRCLLFVNLHAAVNGPLRDSPEFGRGRRTVRRLADVLKGAVGYLSGRARRQGFRDGRWHMLDVTDLLDGKQWGAPPGKDANAASHPSHPSHGPPDGTHGTQAGRVEDRSVPFVTDGGDGWDASSRSFLRSHPPVSAEGTDGTGRASEASHVRGARGAA